MEHRNYGCRPMGRWQQSLYHSTPVNITETENEYELNLYAPALQKDAISITTQNDILSIRYKGEKVPDGSYTRREYRTEEINRSFDLKGKVAIDRISATYAEGILKIVMPKTDSAKQPLHEVSLA